MISYKLRKKKLKIWSKQITGPGWSLQWMSHHPLPWPSNKPRPDSTSPSTRSNMSHGIIPFSPFCHLFGSLCAFISPSIYITYKLNWRQTLVTVKMIHVGGVYRENQRFEFARTREVKRAKQEHLPCRYIYTSNFGASVTSTVPRLL